MNDKRIKYVIFLGIGSIFCIMLIQFFWIKKNIEFQQTNIQIQNKQDSIDIRQFNERVTMALKNVSVQIQTINNQKGDLYGSVKQLTSNYFTVDLYDTLHPYLLERLLTKEFYNQNIKEDFRYGIYDCYSDSIVYGDYIKYTSDSTFVAYEPSSDLMNSDLQVKLDTDIHYFSVIFPNRASFSIEEKPKNVTYWYYVIAILLLILIFFSYSLNIILTQKKLSDIKNDFINNMTHELKTPIATIRLASETLLNQTSNEDPEKSMRYAGIIYKENKRLEQQVERVLNIAKLDKSDIKFKNEYFDIHEIIEEAKESFEFNQFEEKEGIIKLALNAENALVFADIVHVTNIIYNLLDNAIKYCENNPEIFISSRLVKDKIEISIKDNGKGISKENQKLIFDKFYRVSTGNLHDVKGFGLGLFYVKTIVEKLKGEIFVKSQLGKGSTFIFTLPIKK